MPRCLASLMSKNFFAQGDVGDVNGFVKHCAIQMAAAMLRLSAVDNDGRFARPVAEVFEPQGHVVEAQLAEGGIEIHFERGGLWSNAGDFGGVLWPGAQVLSIVTAGFGVWRW
jgi:hypothetical protein